MTGNDIVDKFTAAAESNWKRKGFLEKLFTEQEQQLIGEASIPEDMLWRLWTMKESAYKIYTRQFGGRFFAPHKINCTILSNTSGCVTLNTINYQTITRSTKNYIYSMARLDKNAQQAFLNCCFRLPQWTYAKQQAFIYDNIINQYAVFTGTIKNGLSLKKDKDGIPFLSCQGDLSVIPVSITHHGHFAAFTIY